MENHRNGRCIRWIGVYTRILFVPFFWKGLKGLIGPRELICSPAVCLFFFFLRVRYFWVQFSSVQWFLEWLNDTHHDKEHYEYIWVDGNKSLYTRFTCTGDPVNKKTTDLSCATIYCVIVLSSFLSLTASKITDNTHRSVGQKFSWRHMNAIFSFSASLMLSLHVIANNAELYSHFLRVSKSY